MPSNTTAFVSTNLLRQKFANGLSDLYKSEVPLYADLVQLVQDVNKPLLHNLTEPERLRLSAERHGAIRVGTAQELRTLDRIFGLLGMSAVGYYDLSLAGLPVHATAFRCLSADALLFNPFRVFCSVLRFDLIRNEQVRTFATQKLARRSIFSVRALELLTQAEKNGGLSEQDAEEFVRETLETFKFHSEVTVTQEEYTMLTLGETSRLLADVVCFPGPHINHLTPCTLSIDQVQAGMISRGIPPKSIIEGPPLRLCPILLRQTSFKAIEERISFTNNHALGVHAARFGEIESRGAALTRAGHQLFNEIYERARQSKFSKPASSHVEIQNGKAFVEGEASANDIHQKHLQRFFQDFPDSWERMRGRGLCYFQYSVIPDRKPTKGRSLEALIASGCVSYKPLIYEDFLPASAAGIFTSNLSGASNSVSSGSPDQQGFERGLGHKLVDPHDIYSQIEKESLDDVLSHFS